MAIGTSGVVQPAASLVFEARAAGAVTIEFNLEPTEITAFFDEAHHGPASATVPAWVDSLSDGSQLGARPLR